MKSIDFSHLLGNESIKKQINYMFAKNAFNHALLFSGIEGIGKSAFAWTLANALVGKKTNNPTNPLEKEAEYHPDIRVYRTEGKLSLHSIDALRQLQEEVQLPPYEGQRKVCIIHAADRMLTYSAHALLKTFEEPPPDTIFILLTDAKFSLLPTILSRCCTLYFQPLAIDEIQNFIAQHYLLDKKACVKIAQRAQGSLGRAVRLIEQGDDLNRRDLFQICTQGSLHNYRMIQETSQLITTRLEKARKQFEEQAKKQLYENRQLDQLTAVQQQMIEKEIEGRVVTALNHEVKALFEYVLSWYRDMHLILIGGEKKLLQNPEYLQEIEQAVQRGEYRTINMVMQIIEDAYLSFQRSTSLSICLENLLLKLKIC
jgi:DNA polymerase-3 subunit delta'